MSKQWILVGLIVAGIAIGATALTRFGAGVQPVSVGAEAPDFRAVDLATGDSVTLRERYRGQVTLVNIWATWCAPCREEMPDMEALYKELEPQGFRIAAVSIDEGAPEEVQRFAHELGLTFDILQDRSTRIQQIYQTTGVPESFLLDRDGVIVKRVMGQHDWGSEVNRALVKRLMEAGGRASGEVGAVGASSRGRGSARGDRVAHAESLPCREGCMRHPIASSAAPPRKDPRGPRPKPPARPPARLPA